MFVILGEGHPEEKALNNLTAVHTKMEIPDFGFGEEAVVCLDAAMTDSNGAHVHPNVFYLQKPGEEGSGGSSQTARADRGAP